MKTTLSSSVTANKCRRREQGMAVIVVIVIISILLIYIGGNLRALHLLQRDLKQIEQKQVSRFKMTQLATNSIVVTNFPGLRAAPADSR